MSRRPNPKVPTVREIRRWGVTVDVPTAGRCYGYSRPTAYRQAATGELAPGVPVIRVGGRMRVVRAHLMAALGIREAGESTTTHASVPSGHVPVAGPVSDTDGRESP